MTAPRAGNLSRVVELGIAETDEEREAVFRFWYSVYVEEMGRFTSTADHARRQLRGPEDAYSWLFFAREGREVVAAFRQTWGGDGLSARQIEQYSLEPFLDEVPAARMSVGERTMVAPHLRGTNVVGEVLNLAAQPLEEHNVVLTFGRAEPHLVSFYAERNQRPYAERNVNSEESGYVIPNVSFPCGVDRARGIGLRQRKGSDEFPRCVARVLEGTGAVRCAAAAGAAAYRATVHEALARLPKEAVSPFSGLSGDEVDACTDRSVMIRCAEGDHIVAKGGTARNPYVVLTGALEARSADTAQRLHSGDVFGESGVLLGSVRSADVFVIARDTWVLSLSERALRSLVTEHPGAAAKLWRNIATILRDRLNEGGLVTG
ncbi:MAG TPA: cyclic nucleotide-binding domain-containing protein [Acidimicrobiia bacterium]|jgi:hypothetical protein|nr:cyclic nucleotide-binding domain-containing protein [Acidimicrobiia bacterium]